MSSLKIEYRRLIANRIFTTAIFLIAQIGWFFLSIQTLSDYSAVINSALELLSLFIILYIVCRDENPSYKIIWIILIFLLPIFGGLLYLFAGNKKPSKAMHKMISDTKIQFTPLLTRNISDTSRLKDTDPRAVTTLDYITSQSGYFPHDSTEVKYYPIGEKMYEDMLEVIAAAEHYIFLEYFIIKEGKMWDAMLSLLIKKADSGVDIRIIYDDMGCVGTLPPKYYRTLEELSPNIKCLAFNPVIPVLSLVMNNRDHRKILIADGHTAFNGGINLSDEYINVNSPYGHWKDTGVMIKGKAVVNFTQMFLELWHTFRPEAKPELTEYLPDKYCDFPQSRGYVQPFYDTPLDNEQLSQNIYIDILNQAKRYVYIFTPYLILDDNMKSALCLAAKRGVDVRIVTPGIPDKKPVYRLTRANYRPLLESGVRIFEYTPGFIHAKSFVSDDKLGVVGTINLDFRSLFLHFECGTLFYGCDAVHDLLEDHKLTMKKSREITLDNIGSYYKGTMFDVLLRMLAPLL